VAKKKFEEYNAPWEVDADGKVLETPEDIDPVKLKKYIFGLIEDKETLQEKLTTAETQVAQANDQLAEVRREHENDEQRRAREEKERETANAALEQKATFADRLDVALDIPGISAARARVLAKRLTGKDANEWKASAEEIIDDGFRLVEKGQEQQQEQQQTDESLESHPKVVRSNGTPVPPPSTKGKSPAEELDAAGIGRTGW
jgi:hypothetical protein